MVSSSASKSKPRLLVLSQTLPYPPHGGVEARTFNVFRLLSRDFEITALCFFRKGGAVQGRVEESVRALGALGRFEAFPIPQEWSRLRLLRDHALSTASGRVYTVAAYDSDAFRTRLKQLLREESFDLVHLDSMDLSAYLPQVKHLPVVCVHHNVESALLRRRSTVVKSWAARLYMRHQARLMQREEQLIAPLVSMNVAVSAADRQVFLELAPGARFEVVPNGVDVEVFSPHSGGPTDGVVFLGGSSWFPNLDGMQWFLESVLPFLRQRFPSLRVRWVGKATPNQIAEYTAKYGIEMTGYVPEVASHVHGASCFVVPLRFGGGTRLKILDAWALGMPVVSTSVGCEGLDTSDGENILVRDGAEAFADGVRQVLEDADLRAKLRVGARQTAERTYSWEVIGAHMSRLYSQLLRTPVVSAGGD